MQADVVQDLEVVRVGGVDPVDAQQRVGLLGSFLLLDLAHRHELAGVVLARCLDDLLDGAVLHHATVAQHHDDVRDLRHSRMVEYGRTEEHKNELQSLMRNSYAVICLKKKTQHTKK